MAAGTSCRTYLSTSPGAGPATAGETADALREREKRGGRDRQPAGETAAALARSAVTRASNALRWIPVTVDAAACPGTVASFNHTTSKLQQLWTGTTACLYPGKLPPGKLLKRHPILNSPAASNISIASFFLCRIAWGPPAQLGHYQGQPCPGPGPSQARLENC